MKKFTKKLSLKKKTVANLSGVKGGIINRTAHSDKDCVIDTWFCVTLVTCISNCCLDPITDIGN